MRLLTPVFYSVRYVVNNCFAHIIEGISKKLLLVHERTIKVTSLSRYPCARPSYTPMRQRAPVRECHLLYGNSFFTTYTQFNPFYTCYAKIRMTARPYIQAPVLNNAICSVLNCYHSPKQEHACPFPNTVYNVTIWPESLLSKAYLKP